MRNRVRLLFSTPDYYQLIYKAEGRQTTDNMKLTISNMKRSGTNYSYINMQKMAGGLLSLLLAAAALPDEVPAEGVDLKVYYHRNGPYFWGLFTAALGWLLLVDVIENAVDGALLAFLNQRIIDFVVLGVFASLIFVRRLWWHAIAILLLSSGPIDWLSRSLG